MFESEHADIYTYLYIKKEFIEQTHLDNEGRKFAKRLDIDGETLQGMLH